MTEESKQPATPTPEQLICAKAAQVRAAASALAENARKAALVEDRLGDAMLDLSRLRPLIAQLGELLDPFTQEEPSVARLKEAVEELLESIEAALDPPLSPRYGVRRPNPGEARALARNLTRNDPEWLGPLGELQKRFCGEQAG